MADRNRPFSGARAKLFFDGNIEAGWCTGLSGSESMQLSRVDVLSNIDSEEIEPVGRTVQFNADFVRIKKRSLVKMGIWPRGGTKAVVTLPPMVAEVYDHVDDEPVYRIIGIKPESRTFRVDARGLMTSSASFQALQLLDEFDAEG